MTLTRRVAAAAATAALVSLLGACGGGNAPRAGRPAVAVIPMGTTHEFWKTIHAGALTAARERGLELIWKGPLKEDDRNEQVQIVETLAATGVRVLVLSPIDDRALLPPVLEAEREGIPTVIYNSALQGGHEAAYVSTDNYKGGVLAAERIGSLMGGRGRLILVRVKEGVEGSTKREEGFLATIRSRFPGMRILSDNQYAGTSVETAYQTCENLLGRFPDTEAIFTPNESTTFGCLRALEDLGLAGKIVQVGFDSSAKLIEALDKGVISGLVIQDPFAMGYRSVMIAADIIAGRPFVKTVETAVVMATPDNRNDPAIRRLLRPDLSILGE
jgi:ribose transport system substrate-binding protein